MKDLVSFRTSLPAGSVKNLTPTRVEEILKKMAENPVCPGCDRKWPTGFINRDRLSFKVNPTLASVLQGKGRPSAFLAAWVALEFGVCFICGRKKNTNRGSKPSSKLD